jgi:hypothetical protein
VGWERRCLSGRRREEAGFKDVLSRFDLEHGSGWRTGLDFEDLATFGEAFNRYARIDA